MKLANEFIQGELGWSSFKAREAKSKICFFARVRSMDNSRWPKAILDMMDLTNVKSSAYIQMEKLRDGFKCGDITPQISEDG